MTIWNKYFYLFIYLNEFRTHEKSQIDSHRDLIPLFHRLSTEESSAGSSCRPANVLTLICSYRSPLDMSSSIYIPILSLN